jgi:hypothetical protein
MAEYDEEWEKQFCENVEAARRKLDETEAKRRKNDDAGQNGNGKEEKAEQDKIETQAQQLAKIATAEGGLFHTADKTGYADLIIKGHRETWRIRSNDFRNWLTREFYKRDGKVPNAAAMEGALRLIEAQAHFDGEERQVFTRIGSHDDKLYLDLADPGWNAIEIDADGWRLVNEPRVRFRRAGGMLTLPIPERGGDIEALRPFLNVKSDDDFVLAVAWVLAALRDCGPYPVLALTGVHGAAKSSFGRMLRGLVDPNSTDLAGLPRNDEDLYIACNNSHIQAFDNVSGLPNWLSDTLCRLATGGGFRVRQLYTNLEEVIFAACRPIPLNGIEDFITRPDLADRSIFLALAEITEKKRKEEAKLFAEFERARPKILGALLTAVSRGIRELPTVKLERLPRMADLAKWVVACEPAIWPSGTFMRAYDANRAEAVETVIEADPVATALLAFMATKTGMVRHRHRPAWQLKPVRSCGRAACQGVAKNPEPTIGEVASGGNLPAASRRPDRPPPGGEEPRPRAPHRARRKGRRQSIVRTVRIVRLRKIVMKQWLRGRHGRR